MVSGFYFDGQQGEVRPQPRRRRSTSRRTSLPLEPGATPTRTACPHGLWKLRGQPDLLAQLLHVRQGAPTTTPASALLAARRPGPDLHLRLRPRARRSAPTPTTCPVAAAEDPQRRRQLLLPGPGRQPRAEVRLRLPRRARPTRPRTATATSSSATSTPTTDCDVATVYRDGRRRSYDGQVPRLLRRATSTRKDRLSINVGVRCDQQKAKNIAGDGARQRALPGRAARPSTTPATADYPIDWKDFSPRVGPELRARRVAARPCCARPTRATPSQLSFGWRAPTRTRSPPGYLAYGWNDTTATASCSRARSLLERVPVQLRRSTPTTRPRSARTPNKIDRELQRDAHRRGHRRPRPRAGCRTSRSAPPTPTGASTRPHLPPAPRRRVRDRRTRPLGNCRIIQPERVHPERAGDRGRLHRVHRTRRRAALVDGRARRPPPHQPARLRQNFNGVELTLTKRLSNKWMGRVAFSWNAVQAALRRRRHPGERRLRPGRLDGRGERSRATRPRPTATR